VNPNLRFAYALPALLLAAAITAHFLSNEAIAETIGDWCFASLASLMVAEAIGRTVIAFRRRRRADQPNAAKGHPLE
jgi:hypothetical protein